MNEELEHEMLEDGNTEEIVGSNAEFRCCSCGVDYIGLPSLNTMNGPICCHCKRAGMYDPRTCRHAIQQRLVESRENLRWTQSDLAKATGLQPAAISHFECGQRLPSLPNAVKLADALRVSLDWLTGRNDSVPKQIPVVEI